MKDRLQDSVQTSRIRAKPNQSQFTESPNRTEASVSFYFEPIIEDEVHVLQTCSLYEEYRHRLSQIAKTCILVNLEELFTDASLIRETAKFLERANSRRFPKKEVKKSHPAAKFPLHLNMTHMLIRAGEVNLKLI